MIDRPAEAFEGLMDFQEATESPFGLKAVVFHFQSPQRAPSGFTKEICLTSVGPRKVVIQEYAINISVIL